MLAAMGEYVFPVVVFTAAIVSGAAALLGLSPARFRRIIGTLIGLLGAWLLFQAR